MVTSNSLPSGSEEDWMFYMVKQEVRPSSLHFRGGKSCFTWQPNCPSQKGTRSRSVYSAKVIHNILLQQIITLILILLLPPPLITQLQRKRHIGNDIVAVVYQEGQTPFLSDVIKSHFLHCFLVVRRIRSKHNTEETSYQVNKEPSSVVLQGNNLQLLVHLPFCSLCRCLWQPERMFLSLVQSFQILRFSQMWEKATGSLLKSSALFTMFNICLGDKKTLSESYTFYIFAVSQVTHTSSA